MEYYMYKTGDDLYHWGVKGMKWGIRRYQNKDGSLTPAGKKRRAKLEGELEKLGGKKSSDGDDAAPRKKSVSEMSNKELQEYTTRMQLEKNYHDAQRQLAASMPQKQVSKGQKIAENLLNEAVLPAVKNAGRSYLEKMMKDKMGIDTEDPVAALEKTWKKLDYEQKIDKIKNPDKYLSEEDKNKRQQRTHDAEDRAAKMEGYKDAADKASKQRDAKEAERKAAADEAARSANNAKSEEYYNSTYSHRSGEKTSFNSNTKRGMSVVDSSNSTSVSDLSTESNVSSGKSAVDFILYDRDGTVLKTYNKDDD